MLKVDSRIKVFIRARPLFQSESSDAFTYQGSSITLKNPSNKAQSSFTFDKVFCPKSKTEELFELTSKHIIENALGGYNGTIFAYGQTTSGKTHTMIGNMNGIIPMSLEHLYRLMQKTENVEFKVWISYLEIYNEIINDLLEPKSVNLRIREDPSEGYFVAGLKQIPAHSALDALKILENGEKQRSYRATNIHEHSSRSHSVFRILIESKEISGVDMGEDQHLHLKGTVKFSVINLVDLAGSERMNDVGGDNSETSYINKSLFILTNVINKLSECPTGYIPYRDSKLTRILSSSLGGNAVTSIICTIAPDVNNLQLSLSTLRFATRAKCIRNQPVVNEVIDDSALLVSYKNKISQLEGQLLNLQASKDAEIQKLRMQITESFKENIKEDTDDKVYEFVNVSELGYVEKYKELQKNYKRQIEQKNLMMNEIIELKQCGIIGFDIQKAKVESRNDYSKVEKWEEDCGKLRSLYLMELAEMDERYLHLLESLINNHERKSSLPNKPPSRNSVRPNTGRKNTQNVKPDNYRIRKPSQTTARGRSRPLNPQNKVLTPNKELEKSPPSFMPQSTFSSNKDFEKPHSPFQLVCEDVSAPGFKQDDSSLQTPNKSSIQDSSLVDEGASEMRFNPPPFIKPPVVSENSVPIELESNQNIILFGYNKDGCCNGEKYIAENVFYSFPYEFKEVVCGYYHTAAISSDGVLFTVGKGTSGQLGTGEVQNTHNLEPVTHPLKGVRVSTVACGWQHTICVADGMIYAWGYNGDGQLGLGDFYDRAWPTVVSSIFQVVAVAAGFTHSGALTANGEAYLWGNNPDGRLFKAPSQLKHQVYKKENLPFHIPICASQIALGVSHTLILSEKGEVYSAGSTENGQLGMGINYESHTKNFKILKFANGSASRIGCGDGYSAVLNKNNELFTFGKGSFGRLGNGRNINTLAPEMIKDLKFSDFACGGRHMLAIDIAGNLHAWGYGFYYQLGNQVQEDFFSPVQVDITSATGKWPKKVQCGYFHSAVLTL